MDCPALQATRARRPDWRCPWAGIAGTPHLRLQRGRSQPGLPPGQAITRLERHPAPTGLAPVDHPDRPHLHPRSQALPGL